ncbi:PREDICTED: putative ATP-dependent RNA helicase DHX30 [Habropoda laboriosa]|uniref:putative ATP-dependent RNA helicase DHX30 n=1 Tax=Habropoda laboriosa TaxID=597456 RepID=UPI00083D6E2D|nr:PREDICTED: putative ATP-dependent RNA helicase DHX30 [Habropoda laboriosa]
MKNHYRQRKICRDLPILQYKYDILNKLQNNQILLIKGNTGCGKSTQVPQYIIDAHAEESMGSECNILISEPRRVVALSLANTVANERGEKPGDVVGYHVRFDKVLPQMGRSILYCTQGILLRRLESDPTLKRVTHVIIDEVHERSIQTDLTLKLLKDVLKHNSHIKLIIMSATLNTELFKKYFSCEICEVPGKTYPVNMHFIDDIDIFKRQSLNQNNLLEMGVPFDKIVDLIQWIIRTKPPGGILCFLPGWHEISYLHKLLQSTEMDNLLILPLHSKVTNKNQKAVFDPVPNNITKIILATDIAESGITIVDISYVIDTAVKREIQWDNNKSLSSVNITGISQTNILQRKGRAGRVKCGESFHLITRKEYNELEKFPKPDILKIPLEQTIIISKIHSKKKAKDFMNEMIEVPDNTVINCAVHNLQKLNILDKDENLTNLGKRVKHMSLTPKLSKAVILSGIFQFGFILVDGNHNVLYKDIKLQHHKTSDHIAELKYFKELINNKNSLFYNVPKNSLKNLSSLKQLYTLHLDDLFRSGIIPSSLNVEYMNMYSKNNELIRAVLFAATNHLIKRNAYGYEKGYFTKYQNSLYTESNEYVKLKSSSVNYGRQRWPSDILTYLYTMSFVKRKSTLVLDTSIISPLSVLLFSSGDVLCNKMQDDTSANEEKVRLDIENIENLTLICEKETAHILLTFRSILWKMVEFQLEHASAANHEENLEEVQSFQRKLMALVAKLLHKSSEGIDDMTDDDLKPTES